MFNFSFLLIFLATFSWIGSIHSAPLSKEELNYLDQHKLQVTTKKVQDKVWPKVTVKALINSSPLDAAAVFSAFDYQKNYIPDLLVSKVIKQPKADEVHVYYELDMPWPVNKGIYTNGHNLKKLGEQHFIVNWYSIKSDIADNLQGSAEFIPFQDKTLLIYQTQIDPKSFFAGIFKKLMVKDVEKNLRKIIETIEIKQKEPKFIKKYTQKFLNALSGIAAY